MKLSRMTFFLVIASKLGLISRFENCTPRATTACIYQPCFVHRSDSFRFARMDSQFSPRIIFPFPGRFISSTRDSPLIRKTSEGFAFLFFFFHSPYVQRTEGGAKITAPRGLDSSRESESKTRNRVSFYEASFSRESISKIYGEPANITRSFVPRCFDSYRRSGMVRYCLFYTDLA